MELAVHDRSRDRWLLLGGAAGPLAFIAAFTILGATRPGYDAARQYVSLLALGDGGWMQVLNFIVLGVLVAGAGAALARRWSTARGGLLAGRIITVVGVALAWCGVFSGDPAQGFPAGAPAGLPTDMSWHAGLHYLGAVVVFAGLPLAIFMAARGAADRRWAWYGRASALVMLGGWLATFIVPGTHGVSDVAGLLQRVAIVAGFGWLAVVSARELEQLRAAAPVTGVASRA
jgi:hypothetical protein